jgi:hypothetical protein
MKAVLVFLRAFALFFRISSLRNPGKNLDRMNRITRIESAGVMKNTSFVIGFLTFDSEF